LVALQITVEDASKRIDASRHGIVILKVFSGKLIDQDCIRKGIEKGWGEGFVSEEAL